MRRNTTLLIIACLIPVLAQATETPLKERIQVPARKGAYDADYAPQPAGVLVNYRQPAPPAPLSITWNYKASAPSGRYWCPGTGMVRDTLWFCGGRVDYGGGNTNSTRTIHGYDCVNNVWITSGVPTLLVPRRAGGGGQIGNKIYVAGGRDSNHITLSSCEEFDLNSKTVTAKASMPAAYWAVAGGVAAGKLYIVGNENSTGTNYEYDPTNNSWATKAAIPVGRGWAAAAGTSTKLYVCGGSDNAGYALSDCWEYDPVANSWTQKANMPGPRMYHTALALGDTAILVLGGSRDGYYADSLVYRYNITTNSWSVEDPLLVSKGWLMANLAGGKVYATYGSDCYTPTYLTDNEEGTFTAPAADDFATLAITYPGSMLSLRGITPVTPAALIKNMGTNNHSNVAVVCSVFGTAHALRYAGSATVSLNAGETATVYFSPGWTPSYAEDCTMRVRTALENDSNPANDEKWKVITLVPARMTGGPDAGYMYWIDSDTLGGPVYNWRDISTTGYDVPLTSGTWDDGYGRIPIGFTFRWYGNSYDTLFVTTNGCLAFGTATSSYTNDSLPSVATPNNIIAALWDDLHCLNQGRVKYQVVGTSPNETLVVSWNNIRYYSMGDSTITFQVLLLRGSNDVIIQYADVVGNCARDYGAQATVGIENSNGTIGLCYEYNGKPMGNLLSANRAIRFYYSPLAHDVGVSQLLQVSTLPLTVNDSDTFRIRIMNYGASNETGVPVTMVVNGIPITTLQVDIAAGSFVDTIFSYLPTDTGTYVFKFHTAMPGDMRQENDTLTRTFKVCPTFHTVPYFEDFNSAWGPLGDNPPACGWHIIAGGTENPPVWNNNDWHRLVYTSSPYRTVARCYYYPMETTDDWLISPRLNCAAPGTYQLSFWHWYNYDAGTVDSCEVMLSTDDGVTWPFRIATFRGADDSGYRSYDITNYASGRNNIKIGFHYMTYNGYWWSIDDFSVTFIPPPPVLIAPYPAAILREPRPTFIWHPVSGVAGYRLQVAADTLFSSPAVNVSLSETSYTLPSALGEGRWYWRVRDSLGAATSIWSERRFFDLDYTPPAIPQLLAPANHSQLRIVQPTFVWSATVLIDATQYQLQVATDSVFTTPVIDRVTSETTYTVPYPSPLSDGVYYWHVRARDEVGNWSDWSGYWELTINTAPPQWIAVAELPAGPMSKNVKDGGCLTYCTRNDTGYVYALKGNARCEFYRYNTSDNTWTTLESIPAVGSSGKKKAPKKGAALAECHQTGRIYAVKGNSTLEFWEYDPVTNSWTEKAAVPQGAKTIREGSGMVSVQLGETNYIYLLKGSGTQEFYRFNTATNTWETMETAPLGTSGKGYKSGSCLTTGIPTEPDTVIWALKGSYNEFYAYSVSSNTWTTKAPLPLVGQSGKKKKAKDGAGIAYHGNKVYALKGGNTLEFWSWDGATDVWTQLADLPEGGGKKVKGGGALTYAAGPQALYALKGNNTLEFYRYDLGTDATPAPALNVASSSSVPVRALLLHVVPNPFARSAVLSYSLPTPSNVNLKLYDITGKLITLLASGYHRAGDYKLPLTNCNLTAGIYLLKLETENSTTTAKLIVE